MLTCPTLKERPPSANANTRPIHELRKLAESVICHVSIPSKSPAAPAKSFICRRFVSLVSFLPLLRLNTCLLSAGAFRKQALSLPLWENKDGAAIVLSAALRAERAFLRE
jgi:hypothetical protein